MGEIDRRLRDLSADEATPPPHTHTTHTRRCKAPRPLAGRGPVLVSRCSRGRPAETRLKQRPGVLELRSLEIRRAARGRPDETRLACWR